MVSHPIFGRAEQPKQVMWTKEGNAGSSVGEMRRGWSGSGTSDAERPQRRLEVSRRRSENGLWGVDEPGNPRGDSAEGRSLDALRNLSSLDGDDMNQLWIDVDLFDCKACATTLPTHRTTTRPNTATSTFSSTPSMISAEQSWHLKRSWARPSSQQFDAGSWSLGSSLMVEGGRGHELSKDGRFTMRHLAETFCKARHLDFLPAPRADGAEPKLWMDAPRPRDSMTFSSPEGAKRRQFIVNSRGGSGGGGSGEIATWTAPSVQARPHLVTPNSSPTKARPRSDVKVKGLPPRSPARGPVHSSSRRQCQLLPDFQGSHQRRRR